ncbi:hypothetical protein LCGC14_0235540 [marine sediment metagenome]|uniref:Uncharacterized protein n=1 Tax=marine sediment metagenome TaxID=412755 RepID=A0A0F9XD63_9ZZZZ
MRDKKGTSSPGATTKPSAIEEYRTIIERRKMEREKRAKRLKQFQEQAENGEPLEYNETSR